MPFYDVTIQISLLGMSQKRSITRNVEAPDAVQAIQVAQQDLVTCDILTVQKTVAPAPASTPVVP